MATKKEVIEFYNSYVHRQKMASFNERHLFLHSFLLELGLTVSSNVLELGCGIGVMTALISRTVKKGRIVASDISPASVEIARDNNRNKNIEFIASDVLDLELQSEKFDFIVLLDVLEHIPLEMHPALFKAIAGWMTDETILLINIPNPDYIRFLNSNDPAELQVIDLPLATEGILQCASASNLSMDFFMTYSIWLKNDYQVMTFRKSLPFKKQPVKPQRPVLRRIRKVASLFGLSG